MNDERATIEIIAPTIEEATTQGLAELGVKEDKVEIEVLDEGGKGLFGLGSRQARIRLTILSGEAPQKKASKKSKPTGTLLEAVEVTEATVNDLLERMKLKAKVEVHTDNHLRADGSPTILVDITGNDLSILIGRKAETLDAFQYITRLIIGKEIGHGVNLIVDVEGYRERQIQKLTRMAEQMANQAIKAGKTMTLEPMNAAERRIIHMALQDNYQITTKSVGDDPKRKVTIIPD